MGSCQGAFLIYIIYITSTTFKTFAGSTLRLPVHSVWDTYGHRLRLQSCKRFPLCALSRKVIHFHSFSQAIENGRGNFNVPTNSEQRFMEVPRVAAAFVDDQPRLWRIDAVIVFAAAIVTSKAAAAPRQNANCVSPGEFLIDPPTLINLGF